MWGSACGRPVTDRFACARWWSRSRQSGASSAGLMSSVRPRRARRECAYTRRLVMQARCRVARTGTVMRLDRWGDNRLASGYGANRHTAGRACGGLAWPGVCVETAGPRAVACSRAAFRTVHRYRLWVLFRPDSDECYAAEVASLVAVRVFRKRGHLPSRGDFGPACWAPVLARLVNHVRTPASDRRDLELYSGALAELRTRARGAQKAAVVLSWPSKRHRQHADRRNPLCRQSRNHSRSGTSKKLWPSDMHNGVMLRFTPMRRS